MPIGKISICKTLYQQGFTYIGLLIIIAIAGIAMAGVATVWHQDAQREREKELLFIGEEYRKAIASYYESSPSATKQLPQNLDELLLDKRLPIIKRHIRKLYLNPIPPFNDWTLVLQQGQIAGVYSESTLMPIKKVGFLPQYESFSEATQYSDWKFIYAK